MSTAAERVSGNPDWAALRSRFPIFQHKAFINSCSYGALSTDVMQSYQAYLDDRLDKGTDWEQWVGYNDEVLATGEPKIRNVIEWWKQLFGESEGKEHKGLLPVGLTYTTDLHSLGQYAQDGARTMFETFLHIDNARSVDERKVERRLSVPKGDGKNIDGLDYLQGRFISDINEAAMVGTRIAHTDGDVPCLELRLGHLDEDGLGELLAFFQVSCGISGTLLGVNPYDQPGVEAYKKNLFALLGKPGFEEATAALKDRI